MRWSWPSWLSIVLGAVLLALGFAWHGSASWADISPALLVAGALLLAAGLHALQSAWSCCGDDCCGWSGCDCAHCEGCKSGDCCGACGCVEGEGAGKGAHSH